MSRRKARSFRYPEVAKMLWPGLSQAQIKQLEILLRSHQLSPESGDVRFFDGTWYVTHSGLLSLARRKRCRGIRVVPVPEFCNPGTRHWAFKATVFRSGTCKGFEGFGDADPSNVLPVVHGAEMRVAETRAVNRALRKAYGIGICSVEELGAPSFPSQKERELTKISPKSARSNGSNGSNAVRVRDRLCQLIRRHELDAELVKAYAVDYCGTKTLRDASREQVESFVAHLADWAEKDRNALLCQLNSYCRTQEGAA